ncbi:glutathione S-transferase family protein [Reyranella sp.]|uniref:glutathione S-transferase family protein n=1 Tax=Reyranella sp. TaxID=1929291 RepID=UPI003BA86061
MTLTLHFHPLSSYCHKVLIALYENATPFEGRVIDFGNAESAASFRALWPVGKMPVLRDAARDRTIPESSIIIEYLAQHHPGPVALLPADPDLALRTRLADRFYDLHVHDPMQKIVGDRLRPDGVKDPHGVEAARERLRLAYDLIDADMADRLWAVGESFTLADCAAAPPLFYANKLLPFGNDHPNLAAYFARLSRRPSYARVLAEAEPFMKYFPG